MIWLSPASVSRNTTSDTDASASGEMPAPLYLQRGIAKREYPRVFSNSWRPSPYRERRGIADPLLRQTGRGPVGLPEGEEASVLPAEERLMEPACPFSAWPARRRGLPLLPPSPRTRACASKPCVLPSRRAPIFPKIGFFSGDRQRICATASAYSLPSFTLPFASNAALEQRRDGLLRFGTAACEILITNCVRWGFQSLAAQRILGR